MSHEGAGSQCHRERDGPRHRHDALMDEQCTENQDE